MSVGNRNIVFVYCFELPTLASDNGDFHFYFDKIFAQLGPYIKYEEQLQPI